MACGPCVGPTGNIEVTAHSTSYLYMYSLYVDRAVVADCSIESRKVDLGTPL
jgi:hypothetical protein